MHAQDWYDRSPWASERLPSGIYVLRLPIPDSNRKTFDGQRKLLLPNEEPAHVTLVASALLAIRLSGGQDPLQGDWTRTSQQASSDYRAVLYWHDGRLFVNKRWGDDRYDELWLSAARGLPAKAES